jgi:Tfp pilus assembly protein PilO
MTKLRQLWLLTALGAVAVLAGGYFLLVSPKSGQASALRGETQEQQSANQVVKSQIDQLNKQKKDLPAKQALLAEFAGKIPNNPALPALIRTLSDSADKAGVELVSVTPGTPTFSAPARGEGGGRAASRVEGPNNTVLATIPVALVVEGHYSNVTQFFAELESLNRAMLVGGLDIGRATGGSTVAPAGAAGAQTVVDAGLLHATVNASVLMTTKAPAPVAAPAAPAADVTK